MFTDINEEARAAAFKIHYIKAVGIVESDGYYWFHAARPVADALCELLNEFGVETILLSYPPTFEFVIFKSNLYDREKLEKLALIRHELKEQGISADSLPTMLID